MSQELVALDNIGALAKAEIDMQVTTAKAYPRDIRKCFDKALQLATFNKEIAKSCIYSVPRAGQTLTGASIRLAEIFLNNWTNIHCSTELVRNDGRFISVRAMVIDRETNTIFAETVERSIMTSAKNGQQPRTFSYDMIQTTAAAAASIALRKAAFRLMPREMINMAFEAAKKVAVGKIEELPDERKKAIEAFEKNGYPREKIFSYFDITCIEEITQDHLASLIGIKNALKEKSLKKENAFDKTFDSETGEIAPNKADELNAALTGDLMPA